MTSNTDDIIDSILQRLQEATETSNEKGRKVIHERVGVLYYYFHKIDMKRSESYIKSPEWLINKRATTYPKTENDDNCLQYAKTAALNHQNIRKNPQRISKIKPFVNQCNWKEIKLPTERKDWKKFDQNNKTIALNILFVAHNTKTIRLAYKSEYSNEHENQVILLIITNAKK